MTFIASGSLFIDWRGQVKRHDAKRDAEVIKLREEAGRQRRCKRSRREKKKRRREGRGVKIAREKEEGKSEKQEEKGGRYIGGRHRGAEFGFVGRADEEGAISSCARQ